MLYITLPVEKAKEENQWVKDNLDPAGGEYTFTPNKSNGDTEFCVISIPDDGSIYAKGMAEHFADYIDVTPLGEEPKMVAKLVKGKMTKKISRAELSDDIETTPSL